jgi:PAS domain-containing protein
MHTPPEYTLPNLGKTRTITIWAILLWTIVNLCFALLSFHLVKDNVANLAFTKAREAFNKDQAFRFWATQHGGVYAPRTEKTPSNPYLSHIPERDITTPSGKELTLMNPAYMVRQLNESFSGLFGSQGHITSMTPLRPQNFPDNWERKALIQFEKGVKEVSEIVTENEVPYVRLMRPMVTKEGCLKCHAHQGYKIGDIRGGVSVKVNIAHFVTLTSKQTLLAKVAIPALWAFGVGIILLCARMLTRAQNKQEQIQNKLLQSDKRFRHLAENSPDHIIVLNKDLQIVFINR